MPSVRRNTGPSDSLIFRLTRSSSTPPDIDQVSQRARHFGDAVVNATKDGDSVTLVSVRDEREMASYVITRGQGQRSTVLTTLCSAIGAKSTQIDTVRDNPIDFANSPSASFLVARPSSIASYSTQSGGDPSEVANLFSQIMRPGSWVAVTMRGPSKTEVKRVRRWTAHRRDGGSIAHYSNALEAIVVSVFAGATTDVEVETLLKQTVAAIPGFDIETEPYFNTGRFSAWVPPAFGLGVAVLGSFISHHISYSIYAGLGVAALSFLAARVPPSGVRMNQALHRARTANQLPSPARRLIPPRRPLRTTKTNQNGHTRQIDRDGGYPLAAPSFLVGPAMVTGVVSPHAGHSSGLADTEYRSVPTALLNDSGPIIAYTKSPNIQDEGERTAVHLDAGELYAGVAAVGQPGTGKTTMLHNLWAWNVLERKRPSGRPGYPGTRNALIAFESKGEGTSVYQHWSEAFDDHVTIVEVADPDSPALYVVDPNLPPKERSRIFVSAMTYAWDEGAIQGLSTETLVAVLTASMTIMDHAPDVAAAAQHVTDGEVTFMSLAHQLLGGGCTYEDAKQIATNLTEFYKDADDADSIKNVLGVAVTGLNILFGPDVTQSRWQNNVSSSRNKIDVLMAAPSWWASSRSHGSWPEALERHAAVVVNSGVSRTGQLIDESVGSTIAAMTAYSLNIALKQHCSQWESQGRYVTILSDELAVLAKSSSEVIQWLREQGRSYGVRPFMACQWLDQLPPKVRETFLSFGTMFWFQQSNHNVIAEAVAQLSISGSEWSPADIGNLEKFQAILHATAQGRLLSPSPVRMAYWHDPERFALDQGYAGNRLPANGWPSNWGTDAE